MLDGTPTRTMKKDRSTPENQEYWDFVEKIAEDVRQNFPLWKVSEETAKRFKLERLKPEDVATSPYFKPKW